MHNLLPLSQMLQEVGTQLKIYFAYPTIMYSTLFEYNNGALSLAISPRKNPRTYHIAVKYHFFREHVGEGKWIMVQRVEYKEQNAGAFTKGLPAETFQYIRNLLAGW